MGPSLSIHGCDDWTTGACDLDARQDHVGLTCDCGHRQTAGYGYDSDPTSDYHGLWVCAHCGKPAPLYFERVLAAMGFVEIDD